MHIPPFNNKNIPLVDINNEKVPLNYFNIVKIKKDQSFEYMTPGYETCIVPATGTIDIDVEGYKINSIGNRTVDVCNLTFTCVSVPYQFPRLSMFWLSQHPSFLPLLKACPSEA